MILDIILAAVLIAIAAYYPIKLIKFYCMESKEQGLKAEITRDLREGRVSNTLISLVLGGGGFRLTRNQLDVIFDWMVQNTNVWHVHTYKDGRVVVVFARSPFHPEEWDNYEDYKRVMRQMFGEYGEEDFFTSRITVEESHRIMKNLARQKEEWKNKKREEDIAERSETFREKYGNIVRGSYLKSGISLYIVESVDMAEEKAMAIRLLYSFIKQPAGEKCILPLENGFKLITAEEAAEIILKEYSNE